MPVLGARKTPYNARSGQHFSPILSFDAPETCTNVVVEASWAHRETNRGHIRPRRRTVKGRNVPRSPRLPLMSPEPSDDHGSMRRLTACVLRRLQDPSGAADDAGVAGLTTGMTTLASSMISEVPDTSVTAMKQLWPNPTCPMSSQEALASNGHELQHAKKLHHASPMPWPPSLQLHGTNI